MQYPSYLSRMWLILFSKIYSVVCPYVHSMPQIKGFQLGSVYLDLRIFISHEEVFYFPTFKIGFIIFFIKDIRNEETWMKLHCLFLKFLLLLLLI